MFFVYASVNERRKAVSPWYKRETVVEKSWVFVEILVEIFNNVENQLFSAHL